MGALFAPRFVQNGIAALVISLFGMEGLPENVDRLQADMMEKAMLYLRDFRKIPHLCVYGQSMGSIFALVTAIHTKAFEKVIIVSPSHVPFEAAAKDRKTMLGHSCVMWKGKELPYVSPDFSKYKAGRYAAGVSGSLSGQTKRRSGHIAAGRNRRRYSYDRRGNGRVLAFGIFRKET